MVTLEGLETIVFSLQKWLGSGFALICHVGVTGVEEPTGVITISRKLDDELPDGYVAHDSQPAGSSACHAAASVLAM